MKTNVSIKFSSIEEYREIEKKLEELGYVKIDILAKDKGIVQIYRNKTFGSLYNTYGIVKKQYNSLEEFLKN